MFDGQHMDGDWWVFMTIFWLVLIIVIAWALGTLARRDEDRGEPREEPPQDRLDRRLADGEIDVETYDDLSRRLRHDRDTIGAGR